MPGRADGVCRACGETMEGDGYTVVRHCPNVTEDISDREPDARPVYCKGGERDGQDGIPVGKRDASAA